MRFTLQTLLLSVMVVWTSMAVFGAGGFVLALVFLGALAYVRVAKSKFRAIAVVAFIVLLVLCVLPAFEDSRGPGYRASCLNYLKQIGLALHNYHEDHGHFPPVVIPDKDGKPMHSWRVLILPYMEQQALYDLYDFDEPWDGPNNSKLAAQRPGVFDCLADPGIANATMTSYVAVVGPRTMWPEDDTVACEEVHDGVGNVVQVVEVVNSGINWMEPKDLAFEDAVTGINPQSGIGISSSHVFETWYENAGANVLFADGSVAHLSNDLPADVLEGLLTRDGGEKIDREKHDPIARNARERERQRSIRWFALAALVVSVILLLVRPRKRELASQNSPGTAVPGR